MYFQTNHFSLQDSIYESDQEWRGRPRYLTVKNSLKYSWRINKECDETYEVVVVLMMKRENMESIIWKCWRYSVPAYFSHAYNVLTIQHSQIVITLMLPVIVMGTVNICRDNWSIVATILLIVTFVHDIDHSLRVGVTSIWWVRRATMNHCFIDRICSFIGKDASWQEGN